MLSFFVDTLGLIGDGSTQTLAQGDLPPVAVDDPITLESTSGPTSISVLDNDVDPEGQPLTLVSAFAALGTAVPEADNTVTYTPPSAAVEFDTVVYEIEDAAGNRDTAQIDITIVDPAVSVSAVPGNTLVVSAGSGPIDITITDPAVFAGTYTADLSDLEAGPLNLIAPAVTGTIAEGQVQTAAPGLWIYDTGAGTPTRSWQWQRGGVNISGETGTSYTIQAADIGAGLAVIETLSDAFGSRSASSTVISAFLPTSDTGLYAWWDADEASTITQSGNAVSAWAARNGGPDLTQIYGARQPTTGVRTLNGRNVFDFDGGDFMQQSVLLPASGNVAFHMVLEIDTTSNPFEAVLAVEATNDFQLDANNTAQFDGRLNTSGTGDATALTGGPFSGAMILSIVCDLTGAGTIEAFIGDVSRGVATYTTAIDSAVELLVMTNRSQNAWVNGTMGELIITENIANRAQYHAYLAAKWGLS